MTFVLPPAPAAATDETRPSFVARLQLVGDEDETLHCFVRPRGAGGLKDETRAEERRSSSGPQSCAAQSHGEPRAGRPRCDSPGEFRLWS
jgi:hypothetical protein